MACLQLKTSLQSIQEVLEHIVQPSGKLDIPLKRGCLHEGNF